MANSSLRNSIHRRNHKERSQPLHRAKLGLLEKHKDYVKRARDYKSKRDRLKKLKEKISFRNKDEFYWGMVKGKTEGGVHIQSRGNEALPVSVVQLLKTQDSNYMRTILAQETSKITAIKEQLHSLLDLIPESNGSLDAEEDEEDEELDLKMLREAGILPPAVEDGKKGKKTKGKAKEDLTGKAHIVFVETRDELKSYNPISSKSLTSTLAPTPASPPPPPEDLGWLLPTSKKSKPSSTAAQLAEESQTASLLALEAQESALALEARTHRRTLLRDLSARLNRLEQLKGVYGHMEQQRSLMGGKGGVRIKRRAEKIMEGGSDGEEEKMVGWRPKVIKWKAERKK